MFHKDDGMVRRSAWTTLRGCPLGRRYAFRRRSYNFTIPSSQLPSRISMRRAANDRCSTEIAWAMPDVTMLMLVVVCFALATAYARLCDQLLTLPAGKDGSP